MQSWRIIHQAALSPGIRLSDACSKIGLQRNGAYFASTGVFPIMHVIGVRRQLIDEHPWLPMRLFEAFDHAKSIAAAELDKTQALVVMLPWLAKVIAQTKELMGDDYWPYGISRNRKALDTLIRYLVEQGLCSHPPTLAQLFDASTVAT